jgi:hypothetical protein
MGPAMINVLCMSTGPVPSMGSEGPAIVAAPSSLWLTGASTGPGPGSAEGSGLDAVGLLAGSVEGASDGGGATATGIGAGEGGGEGAPPMPSVEAVAACEGSAG